MTQQLKYDEMKDFASITDALIPSNTYLDSWSHNKLINPSNNSSSSLNFETYPHRFGPVFASQSMTGNDVSQLGQAASFNSPGHLVSSPSQALNLINFHQNEDIKPSPTFQDSKSLRRVGDRTISCDAPDTHSQSPILQDPLNTLKLKAKQSIIAKQGGNIRSASSDGKMVYAGKSPPRLMKTIGQNDPITSEKLDSRLKRFSTLPPTGPICKASSLASKQQTAASANSEEIEDLLAEGRAAASVPGRSSKQQQAPTLVHQEPIAVEKPLRVISESGETGMISFQGNPESMEPEQTMSKSNGFPAGEIDEIDQWLAMTGYYDRPYREKVLNRRRRLLEIEDEKRRLLEEEEEDRGPCRQFRSRVSSRIEQPPSRSIPPVEQAPSPSINDTILGKEVATPQAKIVKTYVQQNDDGSAKRRLEEGPSQTHGSPRPKAARVEMKLKTPLRPKQSAVDRLRDRSTSLRSGGRAVEGTAPSRPIGDTEVDDRGSPDRGRERRNVRDQHDDELYARRDDQDRRAGQYHTSGNVASHASRPVLQPNRTRFFLLKSWNCENIVAAQHENTWATQTKNEDAFIEAFKGCRDVIFFFSANHSKAFQGYARMQGLPGEKGVVQPSWVKQLHWPTTPPFRIRWLAKGDTPYWAAGSMKNSFNEDQPVFVGRDGQEIPERAGHDLCDIIDENIEFRDRR